MPDPAVNPAGVPPTGGAVLSEPQLAAWKRRVQAALEGTKSAIDDGKTNVQRYKAKYLASAAGDDTVCVPTDFYYVEQKKAQLFYRLPDVYLKAEQPGLDDAGLVFQHALNKKLGPSGINVLPRVQEVLFDVLCPTGFGAVKVGFESVQDGMTEVQVGEEPDLEAMQPGAILGLGAGMPMKPILAKVPNIIASRYFVERIAPGDLIVPPDFTGSDFDEAPYLGLRFRQDLPDDDAKSRGSESDDDRRLVPLSSAGQTARRRTRIGYEIYYRARLFNSKTKHPDAIEVITFYDDDADTAPITAKPCPYQERNPQTGKYEGMVGYPIVPLTTRYVSDTWMVPSDCTMARAIADELSKGRTQMIQFRNRNMPQWGYDATKVDETIQAKIARNENAAGIPFNGPGADATWPIQKGQMGRETFTFNDYSQNDLDRVWGLGANQQGVLSDTTRTATELQLTQAASQTRLESERSKVLDWYIRVVTKFGALLQLFADEVEFVELVGQDAQRLKDIPPEVQQQAQQNPQAAVLVPWTKRNIFGRYSFTVKPDSQLHLDVVQQREQWLKFFNFLANEPTANRTELTREGMKLFNYDPARFTQQPPPHTPEPPKVSMAFKMEDFVAPQAPIAVEIAQQLGIKISPEAITQAQGMLLHAQQVQAAQDAEAAAVKAHGGAATEAAKINKHPTEATGGMQGSGAPAPIAPGGSVM